MVSSGPSTRFAAARPPPLRCIADQIRTVSRHIFEEETKKGKYPRVPPQHVFLPFAAPPNKILKDICLVFVQDIYRGKFPPPDAPTVSTLSFEKEKPNWPSSPHY